MREATRAATTEPNLIIVGDEAFLPDEWEREERRRERDRQYRARPDIQPKEREYHRAWSERNRDHQRAYKREWMRRRREDPEYREREKRQRQEREQGQRRHPHVVGSLHDLRCTGPTRHTGCRCRKIECYDRPLRLLVEPER